MVEGMTRDQAMVAARQMAGLDEQAEGLRLPATDMPLIRLALACRRQWRVEVHGLGQSLPVALDLVAVDVAAKWLGITPDAHLLDGLSILEREALKLKWAQR